MKLNLLEIEELIEHRENFVILFGAASCPPCQVVKQKIAQMVEQDFPKLQFLYVDCAAVPEVAGRFGILSVPTLSIYFEGELVKQFVKTFSIDEVRDAIARPYNLFFD